MADKSSLFLKKTIICESNVSKRMDKANMTEQATF